MRNDGYFKTDMSFHRLYIFGAGGSGREIAWLAEEIWSRDLEIRFLVDDESYLGPPVNGIPIRLLEREAMDNDSRYVIAIGDPESRRKVAEIFHGRDAKAATLVHPRVEMSRFVEIEEGAVICAGNAITTNIRIGQHAHVNRLCTLGHDVIIEEFSTLSPGVCVSGNVHIGRNVFIGTGANIIDGTKGVPLIIGDGATIAAGACIIHSVEPGALMAGVPAVRKR
jgi:sugar O-acyltransferase (sialic acid O-acetyltransferase NeuD family)